MVAIFYVKEARVAMKDIYAVQRTLKDSENRLGLFHELENAKRLADQYWGFNVYNIETKKLVYKPAIKKSQALVGALLYMDRVVRREITEGYVWRYSNGSLKKENTFAKARTNNLRNVNCVDGVQWGIKMSKITTGDGLSWYGLNGGFRWLRKDSEARAKRYFNIISFDMKPKKAIKYGLLHPGDTCTFYGMAHTNCYLGTKPGEEGNDWFFDSGHANCTCGGERAPFRCFTKRLPYNGKMGLILRPIDNVFRVQCGVFNSKLLAKRRLNLVKKAGFDVKLERDGKEYVVQAGLFDIEENAINLSRKIDEAGIPVLVKEI